MQSLRKVSSPIVFVFMVLLFGAALMTLPSQVTWSQDDQCNVGDVMLVLDTSGSIDDDEFDEVQTFAESLVQSIPVTPTGFRVGVVQFSTDAQLEIGLTDSEDTVLTTIDDIDKLDDWTDIQDGLEIARTQLVSNRRADANVPQVIVLLTDGVHNGNGDPIEEANLAKQEGITIFAVAVGDGPDIDQINAIASQPPDDTVMLIKDFDILASILSELVDDICSASEPIPQQPVVPIPNPEVTIHSIEPDEGYNTEDVRVAIAGTNFMTTTVPTVRLRNTNVEFELTDVMTITDKVLEATVPAGYDPGLYDVIVVNSNGSEGLLSNAYSILEPDPMILKVLPSAGYNDIENEVHVQGLNFNEGISLTMRLSDTVSGTGQISQTITLTTTRINGSLLRAIVPEGLEAGIYDMTATNPNNLEGTLAEAYSVLSPDGNNDLTAYDYELWVNPIVPREGETVDLGVFVYRYGGKDVLQDVEVRFMLTDPFTGTELGTSTIPFLDPPEGHDSTRPIQVTFPHTGTFDIYAIIDPNDLVAEDNELNNIVMRTITVLPAGDDNTVPVVQNILINGGKNETVQTPGVSVEVDVFDPAPSSGVVASHIVEYIYNIGASQWIPVAQSGWLTYTDTPSTYQWSLQNKAGIHYLHVRAIDGNGNVSIGNSMQRVNYEPSIERVERRETRIYRYDVGEGNSLEVALEVLKGDADLFVWSGRSEQSKWVSNLDEGNELVSIPVTEIAPGVYQIEVYGFTAADYRLNVAIKAGQNANSVAQVGGTSPDKAQPSKPVVEVNNVPDPRNGTIPAVSLPAADDEPVGPSTPAVYLPLITNG